jgi:hypothetical protein
LNGLIITLEESKRSIKLAYEIINIAYSSEFKATKDPRLLIEE